MGLIVCFEILASQRDAEPVNIRLTTTRTTAAMIEVIAIKFTSTHECMAVAAMFRHIAFVRIVA